MPSRIIKTEADIDHFARLLRGMKLPITCDYTQGRNRSDEQNKLMWKWAQEVADQLGDRTRFDVQHDWKLRHGVPILRVDDPTFRAFYDASLKPLPFERKLQAMAYIAVTSEFKVPQMVQFLDAVQRECLSNGLTLTDPDDDLARYQARYRRSEPA